MAFRFKRSTCVVAGTFNMYIVQPAWLAKVGIIPQDTQVTIASKIDEPGFRFSSPKLPFRWFVSPSRVEVDTDSPEVDCGEKVEAVLRALPWTPLAALGNNTIYTASRAELDALPEEFQRVPETPAGYGLAQRGFHFAAQREQPVFNLQLSIKAEEVELSVNVHTELRDLDSDAAQAAAQAAARRFLLDREKAEALVGHFFRASIHHGNSNAIPV